MTPEQFERIRAKALAHADELHAERAALLFYRQQFEQDRIARGNRLPEWDWPPPERRPRVKHGPD